MTRNIQSAVLIAIFLVSASSTRAQKETANSVRALSAAQTSFAETKVLAWSAAKDDAVDIKSIGNLSLMLIHVKGGDGIPEKYYFVFNPDATAPSADLSATALKVNPQHNRENQSSGTHSEHCHATSVPANHCNRKI